jgi:hypothetical protein
MSWCMKYSYFNGKSLVADVTQEAEARRSVPRKKNQGTPPGLGLSMAIAVISGVVFWFWLTSSRANPPEATAPNMSDLTEVNEADITGALTTIDLPNAELAQFREAKEGGCRRR